MERYTVAFLMLFGYVAGIVIAPSFWKILAFFLPIVSYYFVVEKIFIYWGIL